MKFPSTTVAANSSSTSTIANSSKYHNNKSQMKKGTATYKTKSTSATTVAESSPLGATNQLRVEEQRKAVEVVSLSEKIQKDKDAARLVKEQRKVDKEARLAEKIQTEDVVRVSQLACLSEKIKDAARLV